MKSVDSVTRGRNGALVRHFVIASLLATTGVVAAYAGDNDGRKNEEHAHFTPGNLVVSRSVYDNNAANVTIGMTLPPNCVSKCKTAISDGTYPFVWNNDLVDSSFGITSKIFLDQLNPKTGTLINALEVPNSSQPSAPNRDQLVTSFPSKSELALNLSTARDRITFMGYVAPIDALDVSNSNTPGVFDATNPVSISDYRAVAEVDMHGRFHFTETNAYSGNNGRAAVLNNHHGFNFLYLAGNAGNGGNPQPNGIIIGAGAQFLTRSFEEEAEQTPTVPPTPLGSFNITQLGLPHDKIGKDTNFRGLTVFNNVVYYTKGSGGNGINTIYFVDTTGQACPNTGIGLPSDHATLPTTGLAYDPMLVQTNGLVPTNMCILKGLPSTLDSTNNFFPFGIWFADARTLYVAQEGNGDNTYDAVSGKYTVAAGQTIAGLQKWIFDAVSGAWKLAYTLNAGLDLGTPYTIAGYPTGNNTAQKKPLPWAPATDGLRNITGQVSHDGTVTIYAVTSTVSGNGDQGADPNKLVAVRDKLNATNAGSESFVTLRSAGFAEVLRGVSFTPHSDGGDDDHKDRDDD